MKRDSRLSWVLHVLLHMAHRGRPMTSEEIAEFLHTNPVVIRRELAGLRELGYVRSEKGHHGGWTLARDLKTITLFDVYTALASPTLIAIGLGKDNPSCLVERAVNQELADATSAAEQLLLTRFKRLTLAQLAKHFSKDHPKHEH